MLVLVFPNINSIILQASISECEFSIYWYSILYMVFVIIAQYIIQIIAIQFHVKQLDTSSFWRLIIYLLSGIILGGYLGYIVLYLPHLIVNNFYHVVNIRSGGLSFYGGVFGVVVTILIFSFNNNHNFFSITDIITCIAPMGIFFGRIANFINSELVGIKTLSWYGIVFFYNDIVRYPSQLYEACVEGLIVLLVMLLSIDIRCVRKKNSGFTTIFLLHYSSFRFIVELLRQTNYQIWFIQYLTLGQVLSIVMLIIGIILVLTY